MTDVVEVLRMAFSLVHMVAMIAYLRSFIKLRTNKNITVGEAIVVMKKQILHVSMSLVAVSGALVCGIISQNIISIILLVITLLLTISILLDITKGLRSTISKTHHPARNGVEEIFRIIKRNRKKVCDIAYHCDQLEDDSLMIMYNVQYLDNTNYVFVIRFSGDTLNKMRDDVSKNDYDKEFDSKDDAITFIVADMLVQKLQESRLWKPKQNSEKFK